MSYIDKIVLKVLKESSILIIWKRSVIRSTQLIISVYNM